MTKSFDVGLLQVRGRKRDGGKTDIDGRRRWQVARALGKREGESERGALRRGKWIEMRGDKRDVS